MEVEHPKYELDGAVSKTCRAHSTIQSLQGLLPSVCSIFDHYLQPLSLYKRHCTADVTDGLSVASTVFLKRLRSELKND